MMNVKFFSTCLAVLLTLLSTATSQTYAAETSVEATMEEQDAFATKMLEEINDGKHEYAKAVLEKYLQLVPDSAPIIRVQAHQIMKTTAIKDDSIIGFRYPDDAAAEIIKLLDKSVALNPNDEHALSLLVYTHALQGNVELGKQAYEKTKELPKKADWLMHNSALLAVSDSDMQTAVERLFPITLQARLPDSDDADNIYRNSWQLLQKIAIKDPKFDPLKGIRDGTIERVGINDLPEYVAEYDENAKPLLIVFSSQDKGCGYCVNNIPDLNEIAQYNYDRNSPLKIVYSSVEPWTDVGHYSKVLRGLDITGGPQYQIAHDGYQYLASIKGETYVESLREYIDNFDEAITQRKPLRVIAPRSSEYLDAVYDFYSKGNDQNKQGQYEAVAYFTNSWTWTAGYGSANTQEAANQSAIRRCNGKLHNLTDPEPCKLYSEGRKIMDADAVARVAQVKAHRKQINKLVSTRNKAAREKQAALKAQEPKPTSKTKAKSDSANETGSQSLSAFIKQYGAINKHYKALAFAIEGSNTATGLVSEKLTQQAAVDTALAACETERDKLGIAAECKLYSVGKKEIKDDSADEINALIANQQKRNVKNSALAPSYKKYRKFSTDKAYAISEDASGEWVYGMGFGKRGEDKAKAAALEECEEKRSEKGLESQCEILILNSKFVELP